MIDVSVMLLSQLEKHGNYSQSIPSYLTGVYSDHAVLLSGTKTPRTGYQGTEIAHQEFNAQ